MGYKAALRVWRGDAGAGALADYQVEVNEGEVVLDVLHRLQATQASDLAIRWNCKAGKCGSCSMEINGRPRLACMTRMSVFTPEETLTITPMRTFPVIRDLVTDVSFNYAKAREIPSFTPSPSAERPVVPAPAPGRVVQDPGIGEVAGVHDMTVPDPDDLDRRRRERPARRAHGPPRPHLRDHHLRVLGLVKLGHLEALYPQRRRHDPPCVLADRRLARQAHGGARRSREGRFDHRIGREQGSEAVGVAVQDQLAAPGQDLGGCAG